MNRPDSFIMLFLSTLKSVSLYNEDHPLIKKNIERLLDSIDSELDQGEFSMVMKNWYIYLGGERIRINALNFQHLKSIMQLFERRDIGGFSIKKKLTENMLIDFLRILNIDGLKKEQIEEKLRDMKLDESISVMPIIKKGEIVDPKQRVKSVYFETIDLVKKISAIPEGHKLRSRLSVGVYYLIDTLKTSESLLLGLTVVKNYDKYLYNHSVNVAIMSLSVGVRLGLKTSELLSLGQAALLHDIGMASLPKDIVSKPSVLSPEEWDIIRTHPIKGVEIISQIIGVTEDTANVIIGTLEHQRNYDKTGYPEFLKMDQQSIHARVIRIADFYDAVTTPRVYSPVPMSSSEALRHIISGSGKMFDPILVKYFVNLLGIYPMGTLVILNTGEWAIVIGQPKDKKTIDRPLVLVIRDSSGNEKETEMLDLSHSEKFIIKAESPWKFGIDPSQYFI